MFVYISAKHYHRKFVAKEIMNVFDKKRVFCVQKMGLKKVIQYID